VIRILNISFILAGSIAVLATAQVNAQSPDPALLAPGQSGRKLAPPRYTDPSPTYTSPRPAGMSICLDMDGAQTLFGADLIHDDHQRQFRTARTITA
jgi:hypothetical protein